MKRFALGLGSNLGDSPVLLATAVSAVGRLPGTAVTAVSQMRRTAPVGYTDQPDFMNMALAGETDLPPLALLGCCLGIEAALGRVRTLANGPRTIDIDLLLMEGVCVDTPVLTIPHPRMRERSFVMEPLAELRHVLEGLIPE